MTDFPLLTIATCVLNARDDFLATAASLPAELPDLVEWIVVDGGSTDGTLAAIEADRRVTRHVSERDNGVYYAYNRATELARGGHIWYLNAGDLALPAALISAVAVLAGLPQDGMPPLICHPVHMPSLGRTLYPEPDKLREGMSVPTPGTLFSRDAVLACGGFDTTYRIAADYDLLLRIRRDGRFAFKCFATVLTHFEPDGMSSLHSDRAFFEECVAQLRMDPKLRVHCLLRAARRAVFHINPFEVPMRRWRLALRLARRFLY